MEPTTIEIILTIIFGGVAFIGLAGCLLIYLIDRHNSYENNRLHPERYGKISTHYWCQK